MKRFSSYGPPNPQTEFMIQRPALVERIAKQLVGTPEDPGHYFTIFAPRQVGKTTTLRQVVTHLRERLGDTFHVGMATMHGIDDFRRGLPTLFKLAFNMRIPDLQDWVDVQRLFSVDGPLKKPTILILDEFDALPGPELAQTIATFRQLYLERQESCLHGLALIGVHSVLGELTSTMSPFNIQRSVNIPNLTREEVIALYGQYTAESGQEIVPEGVERIYDLFRGQPGLTCWFGELLTEKYNQVQPPPWSRKEGAPPEGYPVISDREVQRVITAALHAEININIRNLISKGMAHQGLLREVFVNHELEFDLNEGDIQWLYLNGILEGAPDPDRADRWVCVFASPFVQRCLFSAFGKDLRRAYSRALLFDPEEPATLGEAVRHVDVPVLMEHYRRFLIRQVAKGDAPWSEQPTRSDARAFEAIGHFNLYAWLYGVAKGGIAVVPEFPTGNGTADLWLVNSKKGRQEVLEVKSFSSQSDLSEALAQVRRYARKLKLGRAYLVVMADATAYAYLKQQAVTFGEEGLELGLEVIPWGFIPGGTVRTDAVPAQAVREGGAGLALGRSPAQAGAAGADQGNPLGVEDRLALEQLLTPRLTPATVRRLWGRSGLTPPPVTQEDLLDQWDALLNRCLAERRLLDLVKILNFTFPELASDPLLMKLGALP